jgi:cell division protein FtsA
MARKDSFLVGLDLGDKKTCALVCRPAEGGKLEVVALGVAESKGWRKGAIVNLDSAVLAVKKAVEAAEDGAGAPIDSAYIGVGGPHLKGVSSTGGIALGPRNRPVTQEDVRKVFQEAQGISLPQDRKLVYAERQEYLVDHQNGIRNPVGMMGSRLEVNVHLVTSSAIAHENVVTAVNRAGIVVEDTVFEGLVAAHACLSIDERELGVALLDIGGGSSELVVYREGSIRHSATIPVGGEHFTNDIAVGLRTPIPEAEKMKLAWGEREPGQPEGAALEVPSVGERPARVVNYAMLREIIEPRAQELLELLQNDLARADLSPQLGAGVVLTGGGAKLGGLVKLAEQTLGLPVRLGVPVGLEQMSAELSDPAFAVVVGLVIHGNRLRWLRDTQEKGWTARLKGIFSGGET